jgi:hypothetical protein
LQAAHTSPGVFSTLEGSAIGERFRELTGFLSSTRKFWEPRAFILDELPWEEEFGVLAAWLPKRSTV